MAILILLVATALAASIAAFFLYVSIFSILTVSLIVLGLVAMFGLGCYFAHSSTLPGLTRSESLPEAEKRTLSTSFLRSGHAKLAVALPAAVSKTKTA
ncbi:MAG: hypothetical protein ABI823_05045 [Bryobacteraceae bacterium]